MKFLPKQVNPSSRMKALPLAAGQLFACGAFCALALVPAIAQTVPTTERTEITGSRIPRTSPETPSPVLTVTAAEATKAGDTTVSKVLRDIPQVRLVRR
jgi:hypothetical protein